MEVYSEDLVLEIIDIEVNSKAVLPVPNFNRFLEVGTIDTADNIVRIIQQYCNAIGQGAAYVTDRNDTATSDSEDFPGYPEIIIYRGDEILARIKFVIQIDKDAITTDDLYDMFGF